MSLFMLLPLFFATTFATNHDSGTQNMTAEQYLKKICYSRHEVERWLAGEAFGFARYHSELGWLLRSRLYPDGVDGSVCRYTFEKNDGARLMINYADLPCRINTYGNSFTQCHQVSDGQTWQEVMAAHLQEPVRNYGIGGYSVYQAYLRMLREEEKNPAGYIIFNIYDDDHLRNLDSWRNIRVNKHPDFIEPTLPYLKVNLSDSSVTEMPNICPTEESLYKLCDTAWVYEHFKDDFVLRLMLANYNASQANPGNAYEQINAMAGTHGINTRVESSATADALATELHQKAALTASRWLVERILAFAKENDKKVLFVLSYPPGSVARYLNEGKRWDQPFVDFLKKKGAPVVDLMLAHEEDYRSSKLNIEDYLRRYFIGHYKPTGNHFCAWQIIPQMARMLDPLPVPYQPMKKSGE